MTWHQITGEEIAACFSEKKRGWRPTPEGCAAISAGLNWLFLNALPNNKPSNGNPQRPTMPDMGKAAEHARLLSREIDKAVEQLESVVSYEEGFGHREKGADPTRYSIEVLRDIKRAIETAKPTLEPRKIKAGQAMAWPPSRAGGLPGLLQCGRLGSYGSGPGTFGRRYCTPPK